MKSSKVLSILIILILSTNLVSAHLLGYAHNFFAGSTPNPPSLIVPPITAGTALTVTSVVLTDIPISVAAAVTGPFGCTSFATGTETISGVAKAHLDACFDASIGIPRSAYTENILGVFTFFTVYRQDTSSKVLKILANQPGMAGSIINIDVDPLSTICPAGGGTLSDEAMGPRRSGNTAGTATVTATFFCAATATTTGVVIGIIPAYPLAGAASVSYITHYMHPAGAGTTVSFLNSEQDGTFNIAVGQMVPGVDGPSALTVNLLAATGAAVSEADDNPSAAGGTDVYTAVSYDAGEGNANVGGSTDDAVSGPSSSNVGEKPVPLAGANTFSSTNGILVPNRIVSIDGRNALTVTAAGDISFGARALLIKIGLGGAVNWARISSSTFGGASTMSAVAAARDPESGLEVYVLNDDNTRTHLVSANAVGPLGTFTYDGQTGLDGGRAFAFGSVFTFGSHNAGGTWREFSVDSTTGAFTHVDGRRTTGGLGISKFTDGALAPNGALNTVGIGSMVDMTWVPFANVPEFSLGTMLLAILLAGGLVLFVVRRRYN